LSPSPSMKSPGSDAWFSAGRAAGVAHFGEGLGVDALLEEIGRQGVALPADVAHPIDPRGDGAVVAVAVVAGRRREVALGRHGLPVDGGLVLRHLVGRDLVAGHVLGVAVARPHAASTRIDVDGVRRRPDVMGGMAAHARRDVGIPQVAQAAAVDRRRVLGDLVHAQRGVVALHEGRVGVAAAAELHDLLARGLADEPLGGTHGLEAVRLGVAAVATRAPETLGLVDVAVECLGGRRQALVSRLEVACGALVHRRLGSRDPGPGQQCEQEEGRQSGRAHPNARASFVAD
jgi:hypothetical protein